MGQGPNSQCSASSCSLGSPSNACVCITHHTPHTARDVVGQANRELEAFLEKTRAEKEGRRQMAKEEQRKKLASRIKAEKEDVSTKFKVPSFKCVKSVEF